MTEKRALGRGLSALISAQKNIEPVLKKEIPLEPQAAGAATQDKGVLFLETARLAPNRFQPRKDFAEAPLGELVESIREKGVLAPILVRRITPRGEAAPDRYEIIAGERRWRAAKELRLERVPAVIRDVDDREALVLSIVENIQREALNPIDEARAFERLMKEFSLTQETVARAVSKDRSSVANILRLLNLPSEVQKAISEGRLTLGHGKALLGLSSIPDQIRLTRLVLSNSLSVRELENYISAKGGPTKRRKAAKDKDPYVADMESSLAKILGTKVRIHEFKKRGKIVIEYYSPQDRERVLKILKK